MEKDSSSLQPNQGDIVKEIQDRVLEIISPMAEQFELISKRLEKLETGVSSPEKEGIAFALRDTPIFDSRPKRRSATIKKGSSPSLSSNDSSEDDDFFANKNTHRRKSSLERDLLTSSMKTGAQYLRTLPDHNHIHLKKATLRDFDKFVEEITLFESRHETDLKAALLIDKGVVKDLVTTAKDKGYEISEISFYKLDLAQIAKLMRIYLKPRNKQSFSYLLEHAVYFPELSSKYEMTVTNFTPFFQAMMLYLENFRRVYDFLALANRRSIPPCDLKSGGTLLTFVEKIPNSYGRAVLQALGKHSFDSAETMLEDFERQIARDRREAEASRDLHLRLFAAKKQTILSKSSAPARFEMSGAAVKHIRNVEEVDQEDVCVIAEGQRLLEDQEGSETEQDLAVVNIPSKSVDVAKAGTPRALGCQRLLFQGECSNKSTCKYSHEKEVMTEMWKHYSKQLRESKFAPTKLSNITEISPLFSHIMSEALNALVPSASILRAVYKRGSIVIGGKTLTVDRTLFDTGALQGCYVDKGFINDNIDFFEPSLRKANIAVTMADNKTVAVIEHIAKLKVQFEHDGKIYSLVEDFSVLDMNGGNQMIVGLPAIIFKLLTLFQSMLEDAVTNLCTIEEDPDRVVRFTGETEETPEEADTPMPCAFPEFLHFTSVTTEEAVAKYNSLLTEHVAQEFAATTNVIQLLKSKGARVFLPQNWDGINGIEPLELTFREAIPKMKPKARPVNPKLFDNAKAEFDRLQKYMYRPSNSDVASPIVLAAKATKPWIRFCGDYTKVNRYIVNGHYPIPKVIHEIERLIQFKFYLDIDMKNAFHQIRLGPITSAYLSLQTIWGQVEPLFLQEGVGPATGVLQKTVVDIFRDFSDWMIVVFDNFLLCAHDYDDAYAKLERFLDRCIERNVWCNFEKSWLGFQEVMFFGYRCFNNKYEITEERMQGVLAVAFPDSVKAMQRFLGMILFCSRHIEGYVHIVAPLYDMTQDNFNWDEKTWQRDYRADFQKVKETLLKAVALYYPDYDLPWTVRPDCSDVGAGALLIQERTDENGVVSEEIINSAHKKFSGSAKKWAASKKEAFGVYFGPKSFEYYLRGKEFTLKTDHANLRYMESNSEPIVMRWWSLLQSFTMTIVYEKGKNQFAADFLSRLHSLKQHAMDYTQEGNDFLTELIEYSDFEFIDEELAVFAKAAEVDKQVGKGPDFYLRQVHGGRMGHNGARRTFQLLNKYFEGHKIPYAVVADFVATCAVCQKDRLGMTDSITPTVRHLKPDHAKSRIGMDLLTVTPTDKHGNTCMHVIVNHFTHHIALYPSKDKTSLAAATALFQHVCNFGMTDELIMDPGSDYTSEMMAHLTKWLGLRQIFSLVDRHESNGVECPNKLVLTLLRALVYDERIIDRWSDPTVLPLIAYTINDFVSSEAGFTPFELTFGRQSSIYSKLPDGANLEKHVHDFVRYLNDDLNLLRQISKEYQSKLILKRTESNPEIPNEYQPGDFVLFQVSKDKPRPSKLTPSYKGPYSVIKQRNNDVECRHIVGGQIESFHGSRIKIFHGSADEAYKTALLDQDQFVVKEFLAYRGEPLKRTTMQFEVHFEAGSILWLPWSLELFDNIQYENFCRSKPQLYPLIFGVKEADEFVKRKSRETITAVRPGDTCLVDIRFYGAAWYEGISLPDSDHHTYVVEHKYVDWANTKKTKIIAECKLFDERFTHDGYFVFSYGSVLVFNSTMTKLDKTWIKRFPKLLPDDRVVKPSERVPKVIGDSAEVVKKHLPTSAAAAVPVVKSKPYMPIPANVSDPRASLRREKKIPSKYLVNALYDSDGDFFDEFDFDDPSV